MPYNISLQCRDGARRVLADQQALLAPSAKRREVFGESHERWGVFYQHNPRVGGGLVSRHGPHIRTHPPPGDR